MNTLKKSFIATAMMAISASSFSQDLLTGDTKLACEAILCLSSSARPGECSPSINKFFSITDRKPHKVIEKRMNFLNLCPAAHDPGMPSLVSALANGAGKCDINTLNKRIRYVEQKKCTKDRFTHEETCTVKQIPVIDEHMPSYCSAMAHHEYTAIDEAKYVGTPEEGGKWVPASQYERAKQEYEAEQAKKKASKSLFSRSQETTTYKNTRRSYFSR